jgi:hypothetical protein
VIIVDIKENQIMTAKQVLLWAPRVLGIIFAVFLGLFALDVFSEGYSIAETILALLMHLIPTFLVIIALGIAWRWERIGAILFIALAIIYILVSAGGSWVISAPLFVIGGLFLVDWIFERKLIPAR